MLRVAGVTSHGIVRVCLATGVANERRGLNLSAQRPLADRVENILLLRRGHIHVGALCRPFLQLRRHATPLPQRECARLSAFGSAVLQKGLESYVAPRASEYKAYVRPPVR